MNNPSSIHCEAEPAQFWRFLLIGCLLWSVMIGVFGHFLAPAQPESVPQTPITAQIIELPESKPVDSVQKPGTPKKLQQSHLNAKPKAHTLSKPLEKPLPQPSAKSIQAKEEVVEKAINQRVDVPAPSSEVESPRQPSVTAQSPVIAPTGKSNTDGSVGTANMGAKAIYKPMPTIPDDLVDEAIGKVIMVRFQIRADGTCTVDLVKQTDSPRLNQLFLSKLRTWKFSPEIRDGKAVATSQELRLPVIEN